MSRSDGHGDRCLSRRTQNGPDGAPHTSMNDHVDRDPDCDFYLHEHARGPRDDDHLSLPPSRYPRFLRNRYFGHKGYYDSRRDSHNHHINHFAPGPVLTHKVIVLVWLPVIDDFEPIAMPGMSMNSVDHGPKTLIVSIVGINSISYERIRMNQLIQHCRPHLPERSLGVFAEDNEVRVEPYLNSSCVITIRGTCETNVASTRRVCRPSCHRQPTQT